MIIAYRKCAWVAASKAGAFLEQEPEVSLPVWLKLLLVLCPTGSSNLRLSLVGSHASFLEGGKNHPKHINQEDSENEGKTRCSSHFRLHKLV